MSLVLVSSFYFKETTTIPPKLTSTFHTLALKPPLLPLLLRQPQFRYVIPQTLRPIAPQSVHRWADLLHYVGKDLLPLRPALVYHRFQEPHSKCVIVNPSTSTERRVYYSRIRNCVQTKEIVHALSQIPTVYIGTVEKTLEPGRGQRDEVRFWVCALALTCRSSPLPFRCGRRDD